jgi:hypothetical protein
MSRYAMESGVVRRAIRKNDFILVFFRDKVCFGADKVHEMAGECQCAFLFPNGHHGDHFKNGLSELNITGEYHSF